MRNCPICESPNRETIGADYMAGWSMFRCAEQDCGMLYLDRFDMTEAKLNAYYLKEYKTDDAPYSEERLNSLADYIVHFSLDEPITDVGGMDGVLKFKLMDRGFTNVRVAGPEDELMRSKIFILSHTLEHLYNPLGMLENIKKHMKRDGWVVVEVPIWEALSPLTYDFHWQHINKFTSNHLEELFIRAGFVVTESRSLPDYREYHCWRLAAKHKG